MRREIKRLDFSVSGDFPLPLALRKAAKLRERRSWQRRLGIKILRIGRKR